MPTISLLSDAELLTRLPVLVRAEGEATADVVEHLVEVERRRLYLEQACGSLFKYCEERLRYSENAALKRARVARLALRLPRALEQLRTGAMHLTGLFLLDSHLTEENAEGLFAECRGQSRRAIERLIACRFPRPDLAPRIQPLGTTGARNGAGPRLDTASGPSTQNACPGTAGSSQTHLELLSAERFRFEYAASAAFHAKLEQARELSSHSVPSGDIALVLERGLDALIERELKRRTPSDKPRKQRKLKPGSRHVPVEVARQVWERDGGQCTFTDAEGRRCSERRFVTLEHRQPFALGGPPTLENLALLCASHNAYTARQVFGSAFIAEKRAARARLDKSAGQDSSLKPDVFDKVQGALCAMGFRQREVTRVIATLRRAQTASEPEALLRAALELLTPTPTQSARGSPAASFQD